MGRTPEPLSIDQGKERIQNVQDDNSIIQFLIEKNGEKVGTIALFHIDRDYRKAEFGAFMVDPKHQGKGIGTKALELLLEYAFNELNLHRVEGGYIEDNDASRIIQEKFSFQKEGRQREAKFKDGEYVDIVRMSLLEDEWRSE